MKTQPTGPQKRLPIEPLVPLHGRSPWSVLPPLILGFFMIMIDTTIVNIAVPSLVKDLDSSIIMVGWVTSAYLLSFASFQLLAGRLGDRHGSRAVFITGLIIFIVASAACGFSGHIAPLIAARAVQGIGAALMTPQTMAIITRVFPPTHRGGALGLWGATAGVATIAGPLLGGLLVETIGWQWIFFVNIPVGAVALWLSFSRIPHLDTRIASFDTVGVILSALGLIALVFGIQEGQNYHWGTIAGPINVWSVIGTGLLLLALFVWWEHRVGENALMPLHLFHFRNFSLASIAGATVSFAMIGVFFPITIFLQIILGLSPLHAALVTLPSSLVSGIVAPVAGRLSDRFPAKWVVSAGFLTFAISIAWLGLTVKPEAPLSAFILPMALFGLGTGAVFSPLANIATAGLEARDAGAGAGAFNTIRQVGGSLGSAVIVATLTSRLSTTLPEAANQVSGKLPADYRAAFVDRFTNFDLSGADMAGSSGSFTLPAGMPESVGKEIAALISEVMHSGFATAITQTMLVASATVLIGFLATVAMKARPTMPGQTTEAPKQVATAAATERA